MSANPLAPEWLAHPADANALAAAVWPRGAARTASGILSIAGVEATALAAEFGTPLYVVDEADARGRAAGIKRAFDDAFGVEVKVYYAGKAFLSTEVARWMIDAGLAPLARLAIGAAAPIEPDARWHGTVSAPRARPLSGPAPRLGQHNDRWLSSQAVR